MLTIARNIICWLLHSNCSWYSLLDLFQSFPSTLSLSLALMVPTWSGNKVLQPHRNAMQWPKQQEVNQWGNRGSGTLKTNRVQMLQHHQGGQGTVQGLYDWLWCVACNSACPPVHKSAPGLELPHHPQNQDCSKQQGNQDSQNRLSKSLSKGMDISGGIHVIYGTQPISHLFASVEKLVDMPALQNILLISCIRQLHFGEKIAATSSEEIRCHDSPLPFFWWGHQKQWWASNDVLEIWFMHMRLL